MNFLIILVSLFVQYLFLMKRNWLFEREKFIYVVIVSALLFCLSYTLMHLEIGDPKFIPALRYPLWTVVVFLIMKTIFFKIYERDPEDTFWSMDLSMMRDGIFNFLFWFCSIMIPAVIILHFKI